jgi:predicted ATP-grasp superfamily ATP-dependent carboligase
MNITVLTAAQKQRLSNWINLITARFALSALNSLDFIANDDGLFLLEVNARPPGSMQLYEQNLLRLHVAACRGKLPDEPIESSGIAAYQILYADKISRIPDTMVWPEGALDLPQPGAVINTHHPICSIIARNSESEQVLLQLANLQAFILKQLR